MLFLTCKSSF